MRLLLVEDEHDLAEVLEAGLTEEGYQVDVAHDGVKGEMRAMTTSYDVMVIDWVMPGQDGVSLVKSLREANVQTPILMLTALSEQEDCVTGLDAGADDYLTKPFSFSVLFARLRALERRTDTTSDAQFRIELGPLVIDRRERTARWNDRALDLRAKEFALLALLTRRVNATVSRTAIAENVWGSMYVTDDTINTTVSALRRKLRRLDASGLSIKTRRGVGYKLVADLSKETA